MHKIILEFRETHRNNNAAVLRKHRDMSRRLSSRIEHSICSLKQGTWLVRLRENVLDVGGA